MAVNFAAQTGGAYRIEKSVIASGGGTSSSANFTLEGTTGQAAAGGFVQSARFSVYSGFWTPVFAPTAAMVSVRGRVLTADGAGIRNARLILTKPTGETLVSQTGSFGYYRFNEIEIGQTYVITVLSKRFTFASPVRIVSVNDEVTALDFIAEPSP